MPSSSLPHVLAAGCGGFIGAALRYVVSGAVHSRLGAAVFPWGTLTVNLIGCFVLGFTAGLIEARQPFSPGLRIFITIGILGGFTTYSTFAYESFALLIDAGWLKASVNVGLHIIVGIGAAGVGFALARGL